MKVTGLRLRRNLTPALPRLDHQRLLSLVNSMADGVIALDEHCKIVLYNGAALNILDLNSSMQGKAIDKVLRPVDKNDKPVDIGRYILEAKTTLTNRDFRLHYADDSYANLYLNVSPVKQGFGRGQRGGFVLLLRDITREKSLEEERDEFISVASHELRTPIAIAEGNISNAQFIADKTADIDKIKQALRETHEQILFLADMINDLSTLSRAERGKLTVEPESIDVPGLVTELAENYKPNAEAKGLRIKTQIDSNLIPLNSSKLYVREILQNFVTNALKYTEKGSVTIGASSTEGGVEFSVSDTGIGISRSDQAKIFNKFFRSEDYRTRQTNGTGLGLYVTKKLAALLGAKITVDSQLNHGSSFTIFVPDLK